VALEKDRVTTKLLTLGSRENRYARSITEMLRKQKEFYKQAFEMADTILNQMERTLKDTPYRPVFGEAIEDHLRFSGRTIAAPISLAVAQIRKNGMNEEGLFRLCPQAIKLNKLKAFMDYNLPVEEALVDADSHLYSGLLKCYLRELPVPLLGKCYAKWEQAALKSARDRQAGIREIRQILRDEVEQSVQLNIQYVFKFFKELLTKSKETKMDIHNIGIVLGPNLLWQTEGAGHGDIRTHPGSIDNKIILVKAFMENYDKIFDKDIDWCRDFEDMDSKIAEFKCRTSLCAKESGTTPPPSPELSNNNKATSRSPKHNRSASSGSSASLLTESQSETSSQKPSPGNLRRLDKKLHDLTARFSRVGT